MRAVSMKRTLSALAVVVALLGIDSRVSAQFFRAPRPTVSEAHVRAHMEFLASDALQGRGSGTRDEWLAASYIASVVRQWGLEPAGDAGGFLQKVSTARNELRGATLAAGPMRLTHGRDMFVLAMGAPKASGRLTRYVSGVTPQPGAVLLVVGPDQPPPAVATAAAAVVMPETPQTRAQWTTAMAAPMRVTPAAGRPWRVVLDATSWLAFAGVPEGTAVDLSADIEPGTTWNVVARLSGGHRTRAADAILLSAHLDHLGMQGIQGDVIFNGADDDASGVTAVLELARVLASGSRPDRTILFAWFGSEEAGGFGSRYFADHAPVPLGSIVTNLQFEMLGRPDPNVAAGSLWLTGFERSNLGAELARRGAKLVADPHPSQNFFFRSDNIQFAYRGIVAHTVSSYGLHREYHTVRDELSTIDFTHMVAAVRSLVDSIRALANSSFVPAWHADMRPQPPARRPGT